MNFDDPLWQLLINIFGMLSLMQILAGNARKVSAIRFERINSDDAVLEAKEVTRFFPKIMKRKWSSDEESNGSDYDEDSFQKRSEHGLSDSNVIAEHEEDNESPSGR